MSATAFALRLRTDRHHLRAEPDLRHHWTLAFVIGELIGFMPPAAVGVFLATEGASDTAMVLGLTGAGVFEGAVLGHAQAHVLARHAPDIDRRAWTMATAAAAGFAWFVAMLGSAAVAAEVAPPIVLALALIPLWSAALLAMGYGQWRVMHRTVPRSRRWIGVTAGAWLVGVMIPVAALSLIPASWPGWAHAVAGVTAAIAMGAYVGSVTGTTLEDLLERD